MTRLIEIGLAALLMGLGLLALAYLSLVFVSFSLERVL